MVVGRSLFLGHCYYTRARAYSNVLIVRCNIDVLLARF